MIRCRCGPAGCISGRRPKSTRASSNPVSECTCGHALMIWSALRLHPGPPLLHRTSRLQRVAPGWSVVLALSSWCQPGRGISVRQCTSSCEKRSSRSVPTAASSLSARACMLLRCMPRPPPALTSPCVVLRVCACSATVPACLSSEGNSKIRTSSSTAPASFLRARCCSTLLSASPAAPLAALLGTCSLRFCRSYLQTRVRLLHPLSLIPLDLSLGSSARLGARTCATRPTAVARTAQHRSASLLFRFLLSSPVLAIQRYYARLPRAPPSLHGWSYEALPLCRGAPEQS